MEPRTSTPNGSTASLGLIQRRLRQALQPLSDTAPSDARVVLAHVLGRSTSWVLSHPEYLLNAGERGKLAEITDRLRLGEPLPVVLGRWEFYGLAFEIDRHVLIPRPETELLVETALAWRSAHPDLRRVADVGTGSGCVAVSIAVNDPEATILAGDVSGEALHLAYTNARRHGVGGQISFWQGDLLGAFGHDSVDLICANLPYIPSSTLAELPVYGREPSLALDGGPDGLDLIRRLLAQAPSRLAPGGACLLEIEASQGAAVRSLARQAFPKARLKLLQDLAGRDRLIIIETPRHGTAA